MDGEELGRRLRAAREARGHSQQAIAGALGLPRTAITQMEAGNRSVMTLELTKLAELYLYPVSHFLQETAQEENDDVLLALLRVAPGLETDPAIHDEVARCVRLCREGVSLERVLGKSSRSGPPKYEVRVPRSSWEAVAQGEQTAAQERQRLGIGYAPIADVSELIASQGIWASGVGLPAAMSGVFLCHPSIGFSILVNSSHPRGRKRFSYAHEYAHALLDRERSVAISNTGNSLQVVERRANAFAAAFLMPRNGVYEALRSLDKGLPSRQEQTVFDVASGGHLDAEFRSPARSQRINYKDIAILAHRFGVSYQAALYRLKSLRHISHAECRELLKQEDLGRQLLRELGMLRDVEELEAQQYRDRELRSEIAHLAIEAYRREEISRGRILEISKSLGWRATYFFAWPKPHAGSEPLSGRAALGSGRDGWRRSS